MTVEPKKMSEVDHKNLESASKLVMNAEDAKRRMEKGESFSAIVKSQGGGHDIVDIADNLRAEDLWTSVAQESAKALGLSKDEYLEKVRENLALNGDDKKQGTAEFVMKAKAGGTASIRLNGVVWTGMAEQLTSFLDGTAKNAKQINVYISSPGGSVRAGLEIFDALRMHKAKVHTIVTGEAASMGTIIAMAGDQRSMTKTAQFMVHEVSPTERQLDAFKKSVQIANAALKSIYVDRAGIAQDDIESMFGGTDTYMSADEAKKAGFIDRIISEPQKNVATAAIKSAPIWGFDDVESDIGQLVAMATTFDPDSFSNSQVPMGGTGKQSSDGDSTVTFAKWLKAAHDIDIKSLSEEEINAWKTLYKAAGAKAQGDGDEDPSTDGDEDSSTDDNEDSSTDGDEDSSTDGDEDSSTDGDDADPVEAMNKRVAANALRIGTITNLGVDFPELASNAIAKNTSVKAFKQELKTAKLEAEVKALKSESDPDDPEAFAKNFFPQSKTGKSESTRNAVIARACIAMEIEPEALLDPFDGLNRVEKAALIQTSPNIKAMSEKDIDDGLRNFEGNLQELAAFCCYKDGFQNDIRFRSNFTPENSFSTTSFPASLIEVTERKMLSKQAMVGQKFRGFTRVRNVPDLKKYDTYDVTGFGRWQRKNTDGTLKHGQLNAEDAYSMQAKTSGQYIEIDEDHLINGDLGTIGDMATMFAIYGRMAPEFAAWQHVQNNFISGTFDFDNGINLLQAMWKGYIRKGQVGHIQTKKQQAKNFNPQMEFGKPVLLINSADAPMWDILLNGIAAVSGGAAPTVTHLRNNFRERFSAVIDTAYIPEGSAAIAPGNGMDASIVIAAYQGRLLPRIRRGQSEPNRLGITLQGVTRFGVDAARDKNVVTVTEGITIAAE